MTTGRINQVAAFLAHPGGRRGCWEATRTDSNPGRQPFNSPSGAEAHAGASLKRAGQHGHAERPTTDATQKRGTRRRKAPFPRILSEDFFSALQRVGDDGTGAASADPDRTPAGAAVPPAGRCRSRRAQGTSELTPTGLATGWRYACTSCNDTSSSAVAAPWPG